MRASPIVPGLPVKSTLPVRHLLVQQKGAGYGQPRQARSRKEKAKADGNQATEHTDKTKARIQAHFVTTGATAIPNR